ncbi:hypothetical protein GS438_00830 [Rhodococcus hoagii]|nr:hypothetical protein [Prescottella equi]
MHRSARSAGPPGPVVGASVAAHVSTAMRIAAFTAAAVSRTTIGSASGSIRVAGRRPTLLRIVLHPKPHRVQSRFVVHGPQEPAVQCSISSATSSAG